MKFQWRARTDPEVARKFLYFIAAMIVLVLAAAFALRIWTQRFSEIAFVPKAPFTVQPPLAAHAYDDPAMWLSRPGHARPDPARWLPVGAKAGGEPLKAAVFFIHPSSFLDRSGWNGPVADADSRKLAEVLVRGLASPFNASTSLWAPRYRQATYGAFLSDKVEARQALALAYADVSLAFDVFLAGIAPDTPIVLVGHSQGAFHLVRLLRDRAAGKPFARRIAAAYVIGWPVSLEHDLPAMGLPACSSPDQSGCVMSWLSYAEPAEPAMTLAGYARFPGLDGKSLKASPFLCSNPLTGGQGGSAPASANLGTLIPDMEVKTGRLVPGIVPAHCGNDGFLYIGEAPKLGPYVLPGNNYHVYDIPLFWANVRADVTSRVAAWKP